VHWESGVQVFSVPVVNLLADAGVRIFHPFVVGVRLAGVLEEFGCTAKLGEFMCPGERLLEWQS